MLHVVVDGAVVGASPSRTRSGPSRRRRSSGSTRLGVRVAMITGDSQAVADSVARRLGIDEVAAQVLPADKAAAVQRFQEGGRKVAMVGDGVNDAPALATADVGIAIGAGTDVAVESAGIVLVRSDPRDVVGAIELSRATLPKMIQNLVWATGYNLVAIPVARACLVPWGIDLPMAVGAVAMSALDDHRRRQRPAPAACPTAPRNAALDHLPIQASPLPEGGGDERVPSATAHGADGVSFSGRGHGWLAEHGDAGQVAALQELNEGTPAGREVDRSRSARSRRCDRCDRLPASCDDRRAAGRHILRARGRWRRCRPRTPRSRRRRAVHSEDRLRRLQEAGRGADRRWVRCRRWPHPRSSSDRDQAMPRIVTNLVGDHDVQRQDDRKPCSG